MNIRYRALDCDNDWSWVLRHIGIIRCSDTSGIVAVDDATGGVVAACVLDNFTKNSVQAHLILPKPMVIRHGFFETAFECIFDVCDKKAVYASIPATNTKALKLNKHLGFEVVTRLVDAWADGEDLVLIEMRKERCRFLPENKLSEVA